MNFILDRKVTISMIFLAITLLGVISFNQLKMELTPNAELPELYVQVSSRTDLDPKYMESQAVIPIEGAIGTVEGVESINSSVNARQATITVAFKQNVPLKYVALRLEEKINQVVGSLDDAFTVSVTRANTASLSNTLLDVQVRGDGGVNRIRNLVDQEIVPHLENVDGIASVSVFGGQQKTVEIRLDKEACKALDLTPARISSLLSSNKLNRTYVGNVNEGSQRFFVHAESDYAQVTDIESIVVAPGPILLKDIATVYFDVKDETTISRVNGKESVSVTLVSDAQANQIDLARKAISEVEALNEKMLPFGLELVVMQNYAEPMETNLHEIGKLALTGGLLAVFILFIFLQNIRLVFFISLAIPISIFAAFNFFYAYNITLNSFTLIGMSLAVGMLLDNSVVVLENIYRLSSKGMSPREAVLQGSTEVWRSIVAATLCVVTVFLPFIFADNYIIRLLGSNIGVSIISTLLISLLVALLLIPMAAYFVLTRKNSKSLFYQKVEIRQRPVQIYMAILKMSFRKPAVLIIGGIALFFVALFAALSVQTQTLRQVDTDRFNIYITMPQGSTLESTDEVVTSIEEILDQIAEKQDVISKIQEQEGMVTLVLQENFKKINKRSMAEVRADVETRLQTITKAQITLSQATSGGSFGGGATAGMENLMRLMGIGENRERVLIKGRDYELMQLVAEDLRYYITELECISNASVSASGNRPEIHLNFDPILMLEYGLSVNSVSSELNSLSRQVTSGTQMTFGTDEYDILIREGEPEENESEQPTGPTVADLRSLPVPGSQGGLYQVQDIAGVTYSSGMSNIRRVNQEKQIQVYYNFSSEANESKELLESYRLEIDNLIAGYNLPAGVALQVFHQEDELEDFYFMILAAFLLIFMILASIFESLLTPFVLMFAIPLAGIGSLAALVFSGNSLLNANTMIGFLILLGVVVNNGIILIDYSSILRSRGYRRNRALMMAGLSRLRPILITSITTIVAMFPMAMGTSEYAGAIGAPFAITVIGGLSCSTLLTLVFIPTVYMALENAIEWYRSLNWRFYLVHGILFVAGVIYIYIKVDGVWMILDLILLTALIPGVTYFFHTSLRRADARLIDPSEPLKISVRNLVKVYERSGRFSREWTSGLLLRRRFGLGKTYNRLADFKELIWQIPLYAFLIYFVFFYLDSKLWMFALSHIIYFSTLGLWRIFKAWRTNISGPKRWMDRLEKVLWWSIPFVLLYGFWVRWESLGLVAFVAIFWLFIMMVYRVSAYLYEKGINIERIIGRNSALKRGFYRMVKSIPIFGKRKVPFKALKGVSFEIQTGMFGLLGPNGAGKSTFMRILCGILTQSYGKIFINGIDTQQYREELQSLIGFLPQEFGTYENMTSWEFLDYQAMLKGLTDPVIRHERLAYVLKSVHMFDHKDETIGSFSGGMKQRIGIALILLHLPRILIVDEPTAGLDPRERIRFRNLLVELSRERIVVFSTHIIEDIASSCNQVVVINKGDLKYFGSPSEMVQFAEGLVWQFTIHMKDFEQLDPQRVVHHMQEGSLIKVRYLSEEKPADDAIVVEPLLEDAYLCLLKNMKAKNISPCI